MASTTKGVPDTTKLIGVSEGGYTNEAVEKDHEKTTDPDDIKVEDGAVGQGGNKDEDGETLFDKLQDRYGFKNKGELEDLKESFKQYDISMDQLLNRTKTKVEKNTDLSEGSEISFGRKFYKHHGIVIDVDEDKSVTYIHLTGDSSDFSTSISSGSSGGKATVVASCLPTEEIDYFYEYMEKPFTKRIAVLRAKLLLKKFGYLERECGSGYNFLRSNCQHFSSYCVVGCFFCKQAGNYNNDIEQALNSKLRSYLEECIEKIKTSV